MILIAGTVRLPAENLAKARAAMRAMIEATRAEAGCVEYAFSEDVLEPGLIHVNERWKSREDLGAHMKSAHMAKWRDEGAALGMGDRKLGVYEVGEPVKL
ncbi:MAG TPA: putative quinol monooxygenase [Hyphomicrobiales bacterium]|nr:putative quinol monooxygenase [Hyphomicrobiales bacterium]